MNKNFPSSKFSRNLNLLIKLFQICPSSFLLKALLILSLLSVLFEIIGIGSLFVFLSIIINGQEINIFEGQEYIVQNVTREFKISSPIFLLICLFLSFFISFLFKFILSIIQTKFSFLVAEEMANLAFENTLNFSLDKLTSDHSSKMISIIISKINICVTHVIFPIVTALTALSTIIFITIFLLFMNFFVTTSFIIIIALIYIIIIKISQKKINEANKNIKTNDLEMIKIIQESINGIREVKLNFLQKFLLREFVNSNKSLRASQSIARLIGVLPKLIIEIIILLTFVVLAGISLNVNDLQLLPFLGGFILSMQRLLPAISQVYFAFTNFKSNKLVVDEVVNYINDKVVKNVSNKSHQFFKKDITKSIKFENVSFYFKKGINIFNNINLSIPIGAKILVKGETGSGKSTFFDLLSGFINPKKGRILICGKTLDDTNIQSWQKCISYVTQSPFIFNDTISNNITLNFTKNSIVKDLKIALSKAEILKEVEKLKNKHKFLLTENGSNISGGQKQRIALARSFYFPKEIMLFDESTNSISKSKENKIIKNLLNLNSNYTVFFISHSNVEELGWDYILEFKNSRVKLKKNKS